MTNEIQETAQGTGTCARCKRKLTNPHSIARGLGPICYRNSGGGVFDQDLNASPEEWAEREDLLKKGGEIDFGVNWDYPLENGWSAKMRVSVRYKDGAFEAYGVIFDPRGKREVVLASGGNLKAIYREAIAAGPTFMAMAYQARKQAVKAARKGRMTG